ncbi:hypothetical protein B0T16DRAFT_391762 [Cercophora newfieldiana]|uniref:Uncharacterized protein n=1 Tax=Cercophora newfieldiana TaxID=92897 RepID=A0AA39Y0L4_9PEZI|nr:hypothetical protein B0T16DRAFT_391762 [Cercophora newfieldiana]
MMRFAMQILILILAGLPALMALPISPITNSSIGFIAHPLNSTNISTIPIPRPYNGNYTMSCMANFTGGNYTLVPCDNNSTLTNTTLTNSTTPSPPVYQQETTTQPANNANGPSGLTIGAGIGITLAATFIAFVLWFSLIHCKDRRSRPAPSNTNNDFELSHGQVVSHLGRRRDSDQYRFPPPIQAPPRAVVGHSGHRRDSGQYRY